MKTSALRLVLLPFCAALLVPFSSACADSEVPDELGGAVSAIAVEPTCTASVTINPDYVSGASSFRASIKVSTSLTFNAGWGLQFDVPEGRGAGDVTAPYVKQVVAPATTKVTTQTADGHYELRDSGAASVLRAGATRTFDVVIAGRANTASGVAVPGLHAPHKILVHQTKSNGSQVFNGKLYSCKVEPLFDHFAYGRTLGAPATDDNGTANPPVYATRGSDFMLAPGYINTFVKSASSQVDLQVARILKNGKVPYAYTYTAAFQARSKLGLRDCNVGYTPATAHTLCERGATWVRANAANLKTYYTNIASQLQTLINASRNAGEAGPKKLLLHVEPDWIQYSNNGPSSFEPGLVNGLPDQTCKSAIVRGQAADGTSTPGSVRTITPGLASKEFEQRYLWRSAAEDPNYQSTAYFSYQYDATTARCRWSDSFYAAHPGEKALTITESKTILQSMLRAVKENCRDCVLVMDASTSFSSTFLNQVLSGLEEDMVPFVGITGGVISPHSGPYNAPLGTYTYKRSFADYTVATGKRVFVITNMGASDFQRAWIEKNTVQAMWNSGVAGVLVGAWPEYETFMTPGSATNIGPIRDLGTAPSPLTPANWYPGWSFSGAGLIGGMWGPKVTVTAPPGALAMTVTATLVDSATKVATEYTLNTDAERATTPVSEIPANGAYSKPNVRTVIDPKMVFRVTDNQGNSATYVHYTTNSPADVVTYD